MREEKIEITIGKDGSLRAKTRGLKGKQCDAELADLLNEIAAIHEVQHTAEAREQSPKRVNVTRQNTQRGQG